jgi:hypothetical protein
VAPALDFVVSGGATTTTADQGPKFDPPSHDPLAAGEIASAGL